MRSRHVTVVIPAYNEERWISQTLRGIPAWVAQIVVVDDGSHDQTSETCLKSGDARVRVVRHIQNRGVGAAIATGYRCALESRASAMVVMGADDQMHPSDLDKLLESLGNDVAYVKGNRLGHPLAYARMPWVRFIANHVLSWLTRVLLGVPVSDAQCGYTAIRPEAAKFLLEHGFWSRYGYPNDVLGLLHRHGFKWAEVVVQPIYHDKKSGVRLRDALWTIPRILFRHCYQRISA